MASLKNYFANPTTLRKPEHFFGRRDLLVHIFELVEARQNFALVGPQRIGKTSLLTCLESPKIQQECHFDGSHFLFLSLDLQRRSMKGQVDFFDFVYQTLKEYARDLKYPIPEGFDKDDEFDALLNEFRQHSLSPVLMMDAFDEITQYPPIQEEVFSFLRSVANKGKISYITASVAELGKIFRELAPADSKQPSPLYNTFATIRLEAFSAAEARTFLLETSTLSGLPFSKDEIDRVLKLAGYHPYLLQQVGTLLFEAKRTHELEEYDYKRVEKEAQKNLSSHFDHCWQVLNEDERQVVSGDIVALEKEGARKHRDSHIYPELCQSALFRTYIRESRQLITPPPPLPPLIEASEIDENTLEKTLKLLDDPAQLGQSLFASIPFIRTRIEQQKATLPTMRGKIVRDALEKALEAIGGQDTRSDEAVDWIHYNILYYRYFMRRHALNQAGMATKLSISERHFYRLYRKALERFKNALLEIDARAALDANSPRESEA